MYAQSLLAVTGALLSVVAAVPMVGEPHHKHHRAHKRDIVWQTEIDEVIVTVPVTKTVWIEPGETPPTGPDSYSAPASSSAPAVQPAAYTPSPESSAPAYSAPASSAPASSATTESSAPAAPAYTAPSSSSAPVSSAYTAPSSSSAPAVSAYTPTTTSSAAPAYTSSTTSSAAPASSSASTTGSGSGLTYGLGQSGKTYSGDLTYYAPGLGACGYTNTTDQPIIAIGEALFDSYNNGNSNNNPLCGKWVTITGKDGQPYKGQIVDRCPGCKVNDLDLSETLFNDATSNGDGRVSNMEWCFD
ncbi:Hypothetical predicted protein [Lecanosticta acicola]|uniref:Uncharacterized protein n=1 Tax=Lecanosticta acicola TaxID=111012 RepID=A0AAI8YZW8_9PEZI|nr:Hypothetical predicted protein [Lecanosticta acicola]